MRITIGDGCAILIGAEQAGDNGGIHVDAVGNVGQDFGVANVACINEIGLEQGRDGGRQFEPNVGPNIIFYFYKAFLIGLLGCIAKPMGFENNNIECRL